MSGNQQNYSLQGHEIAVGLSAVASLSLAPFRQGVVFQAVSGGTCWFGGASLGLGGSFGCIVPTTLTTLYDYRGSINFVSVGATTVIRALSFLSAKDPTNV